MKKETMAVMMAMAVALAFGRDTAIYSGKLTSAMNANGMAITNAPQPVRVGDLTRKGYVDAVGTDAVSQSKAYTDARIAEVGGVTAGQVTNISRHVASIATSNIVTKAYVEGLGISGIADLTPATNFTSEVASGITNYVNAKSGLNTNAVKQLIESETGGTNTILHAESDPTVPDWAKAEDKPSYTAAEVGAVAPSGENEVDNNFIIRANDGYVALERTDDATYGAWKGHIHAKASDVSFALDYGGESKDYSDIMVAADEKIAPVAAAVAVIANDYTTHLEVTNIVNEIADYAFTSSVTNEVAVAFNELLGEGWRGRFGGGLAGILAAIIAAIALLKSTKVGAFSAVGGQTPTVSNGTADLSSLFSSANTSLGTTIDAKLPYGYATKSGTTQTADEAKVNRLTLTANTTVIVPTYTDKVAECILRFDEGANLYTVTLSLPTGKTVDRWYISGDTPAEGTAEVPKCYEMLVQVIPTATEDKYEVVSTTRELKRS